MEDQKGGTPPGTPDAPPSPAPEKAKPRAAKPGEVDEEALRAPVPSIAVDVLREAMPDAVLEVSYHCGVPIVRVEGAKIVEVLRLVKEDGRSRMTLLANLSGVDLVKLGREVPRFDVVYHLFSIATKERIAIKAAAAGDEIASVTPVFRTANWHEREAFDMFGIRFVGHPDLRRILMPDEFDAFPLRKDFPLEGREKDHGNWRRPEDDRRMGLPK